MSEYVVLFIILYLNFAFVIIQHIRIIVGIMQYLQEVYTIGTVLIWTSIHNYTGEIALCIDFQKYFYFVGTGGLG